MIIFIEHQLNQRKYNVITTSCANTHSANIMGNVLLVCVAFFAGRYVVTGFILRLKYIILASSPGSFPVLYAILHAEK